MQNSSNKATPENIQATPFGVATHSLTNTAVDDAIRTLQTDRVNFVLLLTDAARFMTAAGRVVKQTYPRLFRITSVAHGLRNAAERIHANYEDVDKLIAAAKASMVKNKD